MKYAGALNPKLVLIEPAAHLPLWSQLFASRSPYEIKVSLLLPSSKKNYDSTESQGRV